MEREGERKRKKERGERERKRDYLFIVFPFLKFRSFPWFEIILIIFIYEIYAHGWGIKLHITHAIQSFVNIFKA